MRSISLESGESDAQCVPSTFAIFFFYISFFFPHLFLNSKFLHLIFETFLFIFFLFSPRELQASHFVARFSFVGPLLQLYFILCVATILTLSVIHTIKKTRGDKRFHVRILGK